LPAATRTEAPETAPAMSWLSASSMAAWMVRYGAAWLPQPLVQVLLSSTYSVTVPAATTRRATTPSAHTAKAQAISLIVPVRASARMRGVAFLTKVPVLGRGTPSMRVRPGDRNASLQASWSRSLRDPEPIICSCCSGL